MTTQVPTMTWKIDSLVAREAAAGAIIPDNIVPVSDAFAIEVAFSGSGGMWAALEDSGRAYVVNFFVEGIGAGAPDADLGPVHGNLVVAGSPYTASLSIVAGTLAAGLYRIGCTITFPGVPGMVGFQENLLLQVYA